MVDAREYHERTNHSPRSVRESSHRLDPATKPRPDKQYVDRPTVEPDHEPAGPSTPVLAGIAQSKADGSSTVEAESGSGGPDVYSICHFATGVTKTLEIRGQSTPFRAAACTGKLYHVDLYAVTGECGPAGPGVYHFDPDADRFDVLREGDYRGVLAAAAGEGTAVGTAPVTFVATSTWWRNAWKYRERTYRHAFWDSGTILANLLATAHGAGHRAQVVASDADDPVVELLGLDPEREAPLELVAVGDGDPTPAPRDVAPIDVAIEHPSNESVEYPLIHEAWAQSTLDSGEAATRWRERAREHEGVGTTGPGDGERIPLEPVDAETATARPVDVTIERRGSLREYGHEPVSARKLATVLDRALRGVPSDCTAGSDARPPGHLLDCYCVVHGVEGIPSGAYQYHPDEPALERLGDVDRRTAGHLALDQGVVGDAAVNVYLCADVDRVVEALGNRGYRLAMLEAGIGLGRLYLATYAHLALGGRGFTFYDELVTEQLSPRAADQRPMTLFAFGRPASGD